MEQENIPEIVLKLAERNEVFQQYISNLNATVTWYNKITKISKGVEFDLIEEDVREIDGMIQIGQDKLDWESQGQYHKYFSMKSDTQHKMK